MRIGIIGAGQLARMLALAGMPLGLQFRMYDPAEDATGGQVAPLVVGRFDDLASLSRFAHDTDVVTFDWENVPVASARAIGGTTRVFPSPRALAACQERLAEKRLFAQLGIPTPKYAPVDGPGELAAAAAQVGFPAILKTRRLGYDGKGQRHIDGPQDLAGAWAALGSQPLLCERRVRFSREVSLVAVRSRTGETAFYPLSRNVHKDGVLAITRAPLDDPDLQKAAERHVGRILEHLRYVGVLCVEFFVVQGELLANEVAPRVHNSGHWTIEGAVTSQFENHLRAIAGLPLGSTRPLGHAVMVNFIGTLPRPRTVLALDGAHFHDYGKRPRAGRKLGHATFVGRTPRERDRMARELLRSAGR